MTAIYSEKARAEDPAIPAADNATASTRYGLFSLLDSRSKYNTNWFPEPLSADEMDGDQELRINWAHSEKTGHRSDELSAEIEKSFGLLSIEIEVPYSHESETEDGHTDNADGWGNDEISARHPVFQYVSPNGFFDYTAGARVELAIANGSEVSKNTELVGGVYQTIGLGEHFNIQMSAGYSTLFGPGEDKQTRVLEYAAVFGYNIDIHKTLDVVRITPVLEIDGETALNKGASGQNSLSGVVGVNVQFDSIAWGQPKFIVGYVFPIDDSARDDFNWGVTMSLILEY